MVAIKNHEADRFLGREAGNFAVFLIFGTDQGLVSERVLRAVRASVDDPSDPFQLVRLAGDDVAQDPARLADEANTIPLFGGRRAVLVDAGAKTIAPAIEAYLETPSP